MVIEQLYTNCLAEAAYYIESDGEAAIIDPIREIEPYLQKLKARNVTLKYVFETHFHADFVSGHIDLANKTGANIIFGPLATTKYNSYSAQNEEVFKLGKLQLKVLHTPGHTPESTCYLLIDADGKDHCVFTGDTLFVGDVGRPDLLDGKMTKEELAGMMFESLNTTLKKLADDVIIYPAHGAGSSCGKNIGKETWTTIGQQKKTNYAMLETNKEKFIQLVTDGLRPPPQYFFSDAAINKNGYASIDKVLTENTKALTVEDVKNEIADGALLLDTRIAGEFEKGYIKNAINIGLNGQFAIWAGTLLDITQPLVIVASPGEEAEAVLRLARVGYENVKGYLNGGIEAWSKEGNALETVKSVTLDEFVSAVNEGGISVLDVRNNSEYGNEHITTANHIPLSDLQQNLNSLNKNTAFYVHCAGGYRSMIATSIMKAKGFQHVVNVPCGYIKTEETSVKQRKEKEVV